MAEKDQVRQDVDRFILEEIDSVPHLEALLLLWNNKPKRWSLEEMTKALFIPTERAQSILQNLETRQLIKYESGQYFYNEDSARSSLIAQIDRIYRREIVRISTMIHSKASAAVREFAKAFKLKKD